MVIEQRSELLGIDLVNGTNGQPHRGGASGHSQWKQRLDRHVLRANVGVD